MALHIMVHHAVALFAVLWSCLVMVLLQGWGGGGQKTINLCDIGCHSGEVAVVMALLVVVFFLWRL